MIEKGTLKVRQITPSSLGLTIPKELVENLDIVTGLYLYESYKKDSKLYLELSLIVKS